MSALTVKPKFLYPNSRKFPFDEVTEKIVRALEKRNWKVPGITVEFEVYGSGEEKYKLVREIVGENFKLYFCRIQGRLPCSNWNDTAAIHEIYIPKQILEVYEDESGPTYYLYVGENWEADKAWFMNSAKVNSKLRGEPRRYLCYSGNAYNKRARELVSDNDLGREYSPKGNEPRSFNLKDKFKEFTAYLEEYVLKYILSFPEESAAEDVGIELIPYNGPWSTLYSFCNNDDAERIMQGKAAPKELPACERHASFGRFVRLAPLDIKNNGRFPAIAREGFIWCDVTSEISHVVATEMKSSWRGDNNFVTLKLKYTNDVYVVDNAKYEETREAIFKTKAPDECLTNEEYGDVIAARAATIVPIGEYKGNYKEPIVLITRELEFDEIDSIVYIE